MERTRKVDGRTDGGHDIIRPVFDGSIKILTVTEKNKICRFTVRFLMLNKITLLFPRPAPISRTTEKLTSLRSGNCIDK